MIWYRGKIPLERIPREKVPLEEIRQKIAP